MFVQRVLFVSVLAMVLLQPLPARAWINHGVLTREILRETTWINSYRNIKVTKWTYAENDKGPLSPDFQPLYIDKLEGDVTNAREILIRYADEPDWGMDSGLDLSPVQSITEGSQGYRHRSLNLMNGVLKMGEAPQRAKANYELARIAFRKHDHYWGFRYLARTIHYLEDCGEPYHTRPFLWRYLMTAQGSTPKLQTLMANLHHYYEAFVAHHLLGQAAKEKGPLLAALHDAEPADVFDVQASAMALSDFTSQTAPGLLQACDRFWPKFVKSQKTVRPIKPELLAPPEPPPSFKTIEEITAMNLHVTGKMVLGLLNLAKRDAMVVPRTEEE